MENDKNTRHAAAEPMPASEAASVVNMLRNALIDLIVTESTALAAASDFNQQTDYRVRYARARWAISMAPYDASPAAPTDKKG